MFDPDDATKIVQNQALQSSGAVQTLTQAQVLGVTTGVAYGAGGVLDNLRNNWLWYFVVPVIVFLLIEIFFVIKNIMELKNEKRLLKEPAEALSTDQMDVLRAQIRAELEAEQRRQAEEASNAKEADDNLEDELGSKENKD